MKIFDKSSRDIHKDYQRTYSLIEGWEARRLPYVATLQKPGVPHTFVEWCQNNCQGKWSWWFDERHAYIGFEHPDEAFNFKLIKPLGGSI